jgi:hypothetical protein
LSTVAWAKNAKVVLARNPILAKADPAGLRDLVQHDKRTDALIIHEKDGTHIHLESEKMAPSDQSLFSKI